ncbi:hypothetical protein CHLRE_01g025300v5 [Chlamydomonas reinhardtii]|uniref:Putative Rad51B protein n=1 Tax=Chlamydomonas reinhardtii TaxID=3055 RepID=Q6Q241_CHLRE|nr:uncharacterized protein CHLRE_01g025300v5 [Chlamydomonas reinhardtii]AAS75434.1 putative Rad51B protein [Chlamydomonas reinhardtii]PNW88342.1 hypothetical protein CHLRE_01g025300v5 [Chlamydomonas reinhardtii]
MATRHVSRLALDPYLRDHLIANNLTTARDVLLLSPLDLMELLGLTWTAAHQLLADVSAQISPPYSTAYDVFTQQATAEAPAPLRTGLPTLDGALRLGVPVGSITELVGPGGVGKSQLSHMLALAVAMPEALGGLGAGVVYIDTERKFSAPRLQEMVHARVAEAAAAAGPQAAHVLQPLAVQGEVLRRVAVSTPGSTEQLMQTVENLQHTVLQYRARLVVVDSIAALARTEYGNPSSSGASGSVAGGGGGLVGSIMDRQQVLGRIAASLKALAESLRIPVLVTNQVTTRIGGGGGGGPGPPGSAANGTLTAALGAKWAHCVNLRLVLQRLQERRFLKVAKSPSCANVVLEYVIGPTGLQEVPRHESELPPVLLQRGSVLDMAITNEVDYGAEL